MTTPSALIDEVLASALVPQLRGIGFRRAGRNFRRATPASLQIINVQASAWNFADHARFTVNLGLHFPAVAAALGEGVPRQAPPQDECHVHSRIGFPSDTWWEVHSVEDVPRVAEDVSSRVLGVGIRWLDSANDYAQAAQLCADLSRYGHAAVLALAGGDSQGAARHLGRALQSNSPSRDGLKIWAIANGLTPRLL